MGIYITRFLPPDTCDTHGRDASSILKIDGSISYSDMKSLDRRFSNFSRCENCMTENFEAREGLEPVQYINWDWRSAGFPLFTRRVWVRAKSIERLNSPGSALQVPDNAF